MTAASRLDAPAPAGLAAWQSRAIGVEVRLVVTVPGALAPASRLLTEQLAALDLACSRFRPDSEIVRLDEAHGGSVAVSELLADAVSVALDAARATDGDLDPTMGTHLEQLGYDRDFTSIPVQGAAVRISLSRQPRWTQVALDRASGTLAVPVGVRLDLGATAKAWAADRAAQLIAATFDCAVLVSLGGDVAVAGAAPQSGWPVAVRERDDAPAAGVVSITEGGLATSGTTARSWARGADRLHHILDPRTGMPAGTPWTSVTVAAPTCLEANVATTATIVRGADGAARLEATGLPSRLVARDGSVLRLNGWPAHV